jgi:hypothetical protein
MEEKIEEIENKFDLLKGEILNEINKTKSKHRVIADTNYFLFNKMIDQKISERCSEAKNNFESYSETSPVLDKNTNKVFINRIPIFGKEEEYDKALNELYLCISPLNSIRAIFFEMNELYNSFQKNSIENCFSNCKTSIKTLFQENKQIKFDEVKKCLKDCFTNSNFNDKGFADFTFTFKEKYRDL